MIYDRLSQISPLKGGRFDIHYHRRVAEHAEDLFYFFRFPLSSAKDQRDWNKGGKQKSAAFLRLQLDTVNKMPS